MKKLSFTSKEIQKMLPHKFPILLLDKCYDVEPGVKGIGVKNFTINEWFFQGHFPDNPIVPGVLIIESMAQLTAIVYLSKIFAQDDTGTNQKTFSEADLEKVAEKVGYLVKVDVKFVSPVLPGEQVLLYAEIFKKIGSLSYVKVMAKVENSPIAEGRLIVSERE